MASTKEISVIDLLILDYSCSTLQSTAGADHPRTSRPGGEGTHRGERGAHIVVKGHMGIRVHTETNGPHAGKGSMRMKGPTEVKFKYGGSHFFCSVRELTLIFAFPLLKGWCRR